MVSKVLKNVVLHFCYTKHWKWCSTGNRDLYGGITSVILNFFFESRDNDDKFGSFVAVQVCTSDLVCTSELGE